MTVTEVFVELKKPPPVVFNEPAPPAATTCAFAWDPRSPSRSARGSSGRATA